MSRRPLVAIPARFSASASALRYRAVVTARALSEAVYRAGGEPLTVHPWAPQGHADVDEVGSRLAFADAVLLPGGGDLHPGRYGEQVAHKDVYDLDAEQDAFDMAVAAWCLRAGVPLLAICRGLQVVNVARGGTLVQHMASPHRHVVHDIAVDPASRLAAAVGPQVTASCFHHQEVARLGEGLIAVARAEDGTIEAVEQAGRAEDASGAGDDGWFVGVQWHPEDTAATDPAQLAVFAGLVSAAAVRMTRVASR